MNKHNQPLILGIDSATSLCSVALVAGDTVLAQTTKEMSRGQAEELLVMVDTALKDANIDPQNLDCIAVTIGPGSFTGLRIGLSAARGLALAISKPCIGVTTFEAAAIALGTDNICNIGNNTLLVAIETKRDDIYAQLFDKNMTALSPGAALHPDELAKIVRPHSGNLLVTGDGAASALAMLQTHEIIANPVSTSAPQSAVGVCTIAKTRYQPGGHMVPAPQPLYLRPAEAKIAPPFVRPT